MSDELTPGSRYLGVGTSALTLPDGRVVRFFRRRVVPEPGSHAVLAVHRVLAGDRLDHLGERYYGDPLQFWRLCDANPVLFPQEVVERPPGSEVVVPHPSGATSGDGDGDA